MMYKYRIYGGDGRCIDHCDPYGYGMELRPATASIIRSRDSFHFQDQAWMKKRSDCRDKPLNIYEIHFGSFRKPSDEPDAWYTYDELADLLIPHLKEAGYNYLEIMPLAEYPCDDSWGYQGTGFFFPHLQVRHHGSVQILYQRLPPQRHRGNPGLCPDPFRGGRLCACTL